MPIVSKDLFFVHVPKTGGQSILHAFGITDTKEWKPEILSGMRNDIVLSHLTPSEIMERIGTRFMTMERFAVVRNPYDRLVSEYHFQLKSENVWTPIGTSFKDFVRKQVDLLSHPESLSQKRLSHLFPQSRFVWLNGERVIDKVFRFESMYEVVVYLAMKSGNILSRLNSTMHGHYSEYYDCETLMLAKPLVEEDVDMFGYRYRRQE